MQNIYLHLGERKLRFPLGMEPAHPKIWKSMTTIATPNLEQSAGTGFVYGQAPTVRSLNAMVAEIAKTDIPVLLVGESGTGKSAT